MPKFSSGDLYWIENQYIMMNRYMYLEKVKKTTNIPHITLVYKK